MRPRTGSSPRGRGKLLRGRLRVAVGRLIPARAGKTPTKTSMTPRRTAHPRAGGENTDIRVVIVPDFGSSPRGRGKPAQAINDTTAPGLIPARAGKTAPSRANAARSWAHPRAGGENTGTPRTRSFSSGSSPRGRGKRELTVYEYNLEGLIPARAGKTFWNASDSSFSGAHPRAGGENAAFMTFSFAVRGSSPRGRGKRGRGDHRRRRVRLIPARAGKTPLHRPTEWDGTAHPRAGGENQPA